MSVRESRDVTNEKPGPHKGEAYGIASVTQALEGLKFPASKGNLLKEAGSKSIEWTKDHPADLHDIIDQLPDQEYPSMAHVVSAVSNIMNREAGKQAA